MQRVRYHTQAGLDQEFFQENAEQVVEKMADLEGIEFDIVAIDEPKRCHDLLSRFPIQDKQSFLDNCKNALTSVSYRAQGQEIIVIKADKPFIRENPAALRGLLAHELMHVVHRQSGVEEQIQDAAREYADDAVATLQAMGLDKPEIGRFISTVFATAIFCLKDIYANTDLIQQSFTADLEEYYYNMLGVDDYCRVPAFYGEEASIEEIEEAIAFELGLLPAWLPFRALERDASDTIRERIQQCYERDIPAVASHIHPIVDTYEAMYGDPDVFKRAFFQEVLDSSYKIIEEKKAE